MIRRTLPAFATLLLTLGPGACDSQDTILLVPEFEHRFDFESGLQGWTPGSGDLPQGTFVEVEQASGPAAEGQGSVRMTAFPVEVGGRVWIARAFEVTPEESYEVTVSFSLGTSDDGTVVPWEVVSGAMTEVPTAGHLDIGGDTEPATPGGGLVWEARTQTLQLLSGPAGAGDTVTVWIALGIGIAAVDDREYRFDEIEVSFLRS